MSALLLKVSGESPSGWNTLLEADPDSDFFHTTTWVGNVCRHYSGMEPVFLEAWLADKLVGAMVAFKHSSGGTGGLAVRLDCGFDGTSGGPIVPANFLPGQQDEIALALLLRFFSLRSRFFGVATLSLNEGHEKRFGHLLRNQPGLSRVPITGAAVELTGGSEEVSARKMSMNKRNERNKGLRRGAEIVTSMDPALVAEYYPIYKSASEYWGIDPVPLGFLQDLLVGGDGKVFFVAIMVEGKVTGGHLNLHHGARVIAWNGVTDPAYARTHHPATLCMWGDIEEACRRGARWLDMGASGGVTSLEGYKKYFGAVLEERALYLNESALFSAIRRSRGWLRGQLSATGASSSPTEESGRWHDKAKPSSENTPKGDN